MKFHFSANLAVLLLELKKRQCFAFVPLEEITGKLPLLPEHLGGGKIANIRSDWLTWGKKKGYIT